MSHTAKGGWRMGHSIGTPEREALVQKGKELWSRPSVRRLAGHLRDGLTAFVLSAAASGSVPLPLCLGFLVGLEADWSALAAAAGGCLGAFLFWGAGGCLEPIAGMVAGLLGAAVFAGTELRKRPWFLPALSAGVTAALGAVFLLGKSSVPGAELLGYLLRTGFAALSAAAFARPKGPWAAGLMVLALCQMQVLKVVNLGLGAAALLACLHPGSLLWALACGAGADLSRITAVPITPVLCLAALPLAPGKGLYRLAPALWSCPAMYVAGTFDPYVPLGLLAGGLASLPFPGKTARPKAAPPPAAAPLEAAAGALEYLRELLEQPVPGGVRPGELFDQAAEEACRGCSRWSQCWEQEAEETYRLLSRAAPPILERCQVTQEDLPAFLSRCRRPDAFLEATDRAVARLRLRRQYEAKLREGRQALANQYRFLARFLREAAEEQPEAAPQYRVELGIGATGKFGLRASGDRGAHFPGPGARYYVILCDGMGAGPGAAQESAGALRLLVGMLQAGLPPEAALETLNDLYVLRETGGFSTADLLELHLDTGRATLYKWGGAPSYVKYRHTVQKIGTAAPPPGVGIGKSHRAEVIRLSLQKGQTLVLASDGLAEAETQSRIAEFTGQSPKALAALLAAGTGAQEEDDRTAVAVCLRPVSSATT